MALARGEARRLAVRSLFLQVLLNYHTMQGGGYLFALWPWLRQTGQSPQRVKVSADYLNAHPVLAAFAVGALRRRLEEGDLEKDPQAFAEWQTELCGPLGMVGDSLIWDRWKPLLFSLAVLVMLCFPTLHVWMAVAASSLLLYNLPLFYLRVWGVEEGYRLGTDVLSVLNRSAIARARRVLGVTGAVLAGLLFAVAFDRTLSDSMFYCGQFLLAFSVVLLLTRRQWLITWSVLFALLAVFLLPQFVRALH
ncbi:MAG TPA: PTS system mannose/fructose/sorbose family transporter subunit IID [bacterium]|jgi:mannose/fructose/N-acetylgalactosamine-specific phosphotransferase system component IID